jgi:anti-anti-sigma factor
MAEIIRTNIGVTTYLTPTGAISDKESLASLRDAFAECVEAGTKKVVVVMERVPTITGEVLEFLLDAQDELVANGGQLSVTHPNALLKDIFKITDFDKYVEVKDRA